MSPAPALPALAAACRSCCRGKTLRQRRLQGEHDAAFRAVEERRIAARADLPSIVRIALTSLQGTSAIPL
jgi:hypothetical protein